MGFEDEVTIAVLDSEEVLLGFLNPKHVRIKETNELYKLRTIKIQHQLYDEDNQDLTRYDTLLTAGNKIWKKESGDGDSVLYILRGNKEYGDNFKDITIEGIEAAAELGQIEVFRDDEFTWTINSAWVTTYTGNLFDEGTLTGPAIDTSYSGALTALAIIQEVQKNTGGEFQFRYEYDPLNKRINRYIDYLTTVGKTHDQVIEIGYNAKNIKLEIDESDVAVAAAPVGKPSNPGSSTDTFHVDRTAWEALHIDKTDLIPLYVTKDDAGNPLNGPDTAAPYDKDAGNNFVENDVPGELVANYQRIYYKAGTVGDDPRIITFESSETNEYNMYWDCVDKIREHLNPEVNIECDIVDLSKLEGADGELFNIGDTIYIKLPGRTDAIQCRITKTVKDPRHPESMDITINTYRMSFMQDFFQSTFKGHANIDL